MSRITSDPFEALTPEAQAAILSVLEPAAVGAGGGPVPPHLTTPLAAGAPRGPPPLRRVQNGCAVHDGLYDGDTHVLGRSVTSGGIQPSCMCPAVRRLDFGSPVSTGTLPAPEEEVDAPPPLPEPAALGPAPNTNDWFYHSQARQVSLNDVMGGGSALDSSRYGSFRLQRTSAIGRERPPPPAWPVQERPIALAGGAAAAAGAAPPPRVILNPEEEEMDAPPVPEPEGTPPGTPLPGPPRPMWRQGSIGEAGPFIGLAYGYSVELVKRMRLYPGTDTFALKEQMLADLYESPDLIRDFTEEEVYEGMAASYSWSTERTRGFLEALRWVGR